MSKRFQNCPKDWIGILHINSQTFCIQGLSAEGATADVKKANTRPSSPFLWFNLISLFFSFLFVQILPYGQVDRLLKMSLGAIPPSLMILFCTERPRERNEQKKEQELMGGSSNSASELAPSYTDDWVKQPLAQTTDLKTFQEQTHSCTTAT